MSLKMFLIVLIVKVTLRGCEVVYEACPRAFKSKIWWKRTAFNLMTIQDCPDGMIGSASRVCNETEGWIEPELFNCTSMLFVELKNQVHSPFGI